MEVGEYTLNSSEIQLFLRFHALHYIVIIDELHVGFTRVWIIHFNAAYLKFLVQTVARWCVYFKYTEKEIVEIRLWKYPQQTRVFSGV